VFRLAAEQQVRIRRLNFRRDTLEDIFLQLVGRPLDEDTEAQVESS
jgi:hypothetical protein